MIVAPCSLRTRSIEDQPRSRRRRHRVHRRKRGLICEYIMLCIPSVVSRHGGNSNQILLAKCWRLHGPWPQSLPRLCSPIGGGSGGRRLAQRRPSCRESPVHWNLRVRVIHRARIPNAHQDRRSDVHFWHAGRIGPMVVGGKHILGHESAGEVRSPASQSLACH